MRRLFACLTLMGLLYSHVAHATIFGQVQGIVHDPQHRPIRGATVTIHAAHCGLHHNSLLQ